MRSCSETPETRSLIACGWSPAGSKSRDHLDGDAAFRLFRSGRAVRHPQLAVLVQRVAALDQRGKRRDRGGDAGIIQRADIFERDVEAGDRIEAGRGALLGCRRAAHRRAARGLGRAQRSARGFFSTAWASIAFRPLSRSARPSRRSSRTAACRTTPPAVLRQNPCAPAARPRPIIRQRIAALAIGHAVRGRRFLFGDFGHDPNMGRVSRNGKCQLGGRSRPGSHADSRVSGGRALAKPAAERLWSARVELSAVLQAVVAAAPAEAVAGGQ